MMTVAFPFFLYGPRGFPGVDPRFLGCVVRFVADNDTGVALLLVVLFTGVVLPMTVLTVSTIENPGGCCMGSHGYFLAHKGKS